MPDGSEYAFPIGYWQAHMLMWNYFSKHGLPCPNGIKMPRSVASKELFAKAELSPQAVVEFRQVRKEAGRTVRGMSRLDAAKFFLEKFPQGSFPSFRRDLLAWIEMHGGLDSMQKRQAHQKRIEQLDARIYAERLDLSAEIGKVASLDAFACIFVCILDEKDELT
jgi:hypothetical protein